MSCRRFFISVMAGLLLWPAVAQAWWNEEWTARKPLQVDTSAAGANLTSPVGTTPVLVRLHLGNFHFDQAKDDGSDLRFIGADDKTPLPFHLEAFDPLLGEALAWVSLPDLKPGAKTRFWLYYRNPKALPAQNAAGTYDGPTQLVWHFAERGQPPRDSSAFANHATAAGEGAEGTLIGRGLRADGAANVTLPASPSLTWAKGGRLTWSLWIKPGSADQSSVVFARRSGAAAMLVGLDAGKPFVELSSETGTARAASTAAINAGGWHHLAVTVGEALVLYVDGAEAARTPAALPALASAATLGSDPGAPARAPGKKDGAGSAAARQAGFKGELDELQISSVERTAGFIQLASITQGTDPGKAVTAGQDEETAGSGGGYFAVIIKSVTPDGWVVIGLLAIMAVVSVWVMIQKTMLLNGVQGANGRFGKQFRQAAADLRRLVETSNGSSPLGDEERLLKSTLYRLCKISLEETRRRTSTGRPLSAEGIESIRASLDAEQVRVGQELGARMVLLTIAISGGPFLGLLGTVVGVMITFAAIAAAGDVNVNAIAPGIAAALVATVAGLAVAIPSLFGYNWLLTRIKSVVATQQVFVDELVTKLAEAYSEHEVGLRTGTHLAPHPPPLPPGAA